MKDIELGGDILQLPADVFDTGDQRGTITDSGTTLAYLPEEVYNPMLKKVHYSMNFFLDVHVYSLQLTV